MNRLFTHVMRMRFISISSLMNYIYYLGLVSVKQLVKRFKNFTHCLVFRFSIGCSLYLIILSKVIFLFGHKALFYKRTGFFIFIAHFSFEILLDVFGSSAVDSHFLILNCRSLTELIPLPIFASLLQVWWSKILFWTFLRVSSEC